MTYSLAELTNRMQGKSITRGWDAVVFMNRAKVNSLLEQQYITRFNKDSFMKRIFGAPAMTPDGKESLELSGLILSQPRLSFQKASLRDSRVTATMDIVSGTISYVRKGTNQLPGAILYSYVVSAHQGYTVTMDINLAASKGTVNEQGQVIVDIGDGYNCRCNLVNEDKSQELLGDFFKALFLEQKPEDRVYTLGMLDLRDVDLLAPRSFKIRTMATDEGKIRTSDDYGEGAVVLLVRTKGNPKEGDDPAEGALDYLIPNDRDPQGKPIYSGSLVLASRVVFDWYFQYQIQNKIAQGLRFDRGAESNYIARRLYATSGEIEWGGFYRKYDERPGAQHKELSNNGPVGYKFYNVVPEEGFRVFASEGALSVSCSGLQYLKFMIRHWRWIGETTHDYFNFNVRSHVDYIFSPVVDPTSGKVTFEARSQNPSEVSVNIDYSELGRHDVPSDIQDDVRAVYNSEAEKVVRLFNDSAIKDSFDIPEINVLAISNLLFPERNALQLTQARLPGDLALFGHIDPKETTFTLDPLLPVIKAGEKQTFTIRQLGIKTANVTWSVRSVDGTRAAGTIDNGEYTAPAIQLLEGTAVRNVVAATYTDPATAKEVTASALVTVVMAGVVVTPSMSLIDMSDREKSVTLKATSLGAGSLKWTPRGSLGTLVPKGNEATYTAPETDLPDGTLQAVLFDVENTGTGEKAVATVLLRQGNFAMNIAPAIHPGLRPNGSALLKAPSNVRPDQLKWEVVAGGGRIDPRTGVFTAPATLSVPYSVVKVSHEGEFFDTLGYSIIHLSDHARQSNWFAPDVFDFVVEPSPTRVWANGLQQARVVVRFRPADYEGAPDPLELSEAEYNSIRLVSADEKNPLPEVGEDGVPEGGKWYFNADENGYKKYQELASTSQLMAPGQEREAPMVTKEFFVQCHKVENLLVSASIRSDNYETFYSNPGKDDGEHNRKALNLVAVAPPEGGTIGQVVFTFGDKDPDRVEGDKDDEVDLNTTDYYYLKLLIKGVQVGIKDIKFVGNSSMVKWESDTQLEDIHSVTGYALPDDRNDKGDQILHIDEILLRRLGSSAPAPIVKPSWPVPNGQVLFSLHRRQYWRYDKYAKSDFDSALDVIVYDVYGNKHSVRIGFEGNNRNKLKIIGS
ncbi:hypothetical protein ACN1C3_33030 [Pseudomonas sp. H11T01]|uniref:hypothetical protein n=1 Tax=Pseudomonas sp. H11T01 TaxID=3402749 RepID=UPI003AC3C43A